MDKFKTFSEVKKSKKEIKPQAQDELMSAMQTAFKGSIDPEVRKEMDRQMKRVEKLFGYTQGSWHRGA